MFLCEKPLNICVLFNIILIVFIIVAYVFLAGCQFGDTVESYINVEATEELLNKDEIIHFDEIGYYHPPYFTCPTAYNMIIGRRCICSSLSSQNIPLDTLSCLRRWWRYGSGKKFMKEL